MMIMVLKELSCVSDIFLIYTPKTKLQFSLSRAEYTTNKSSGFRSNLKDDVRPINYTHKI